MYWPGQQGMIMEVTSEQSLRRELGRDESLLWSGAPEQGLRLRPSDALAIPFSLMWGGFALFWEYSVIAQTNAPIIFRLWGIPFVVFGLYLIVGRFFVDAYQRRRTFYGVTSKRVVIVSGAFSRKVTSLALDTLSDISLSERNNGKGSIRFGPAPAGRNMGMMGASWPGAGKYLPPTFDLLVNVRRTYELILSARQAARPTPAVIPA